MNTVRDGDALVGPVGAEYELDAGGRPSSSRLNASGRPPAHLQAEKGGPVAGCAALAVQADSNPARDYWPLHPRPELKQKSKLKCWNSRTIYGGARKRVGIGLSYRTARLHRVAESIPGFLKKTFLSPRIVRD